MQRKAQQKTQPRKKERESTVMLSLIGRCDKIKVAQRRGPKVFSPLISIRELQLLSSPLARLSALFPYLAYCARFSDSISTPSTPVPITADQRSSTVSFCHVTKKKTSSASRWGSSFFPDQITYYFRLNGPLLFSLLLLLLESSLSILSETSFTESAGKEYRSNKERRVRSNGNSMRGVQQQQNPSEARALPSSFYTYLSLSSQSSKEEEDGRHVFSLSFSFYLDLYSLLSGYLIGPSVRLFFWLDSVGGVVPDERTKKKGGGDHFAIRCRPLACDWGAPIRTDAKPSSIAVENTPVCVWSSFHLKAFGGRRTSDRWMPFRSSLSLSLFPSHSFYIIIIKYL